MQMFVIHMQRADCAKGKQEKPKRSKSDESACLQYLVIHGPNEGFDAQRIDMRHPIQNKIKIMKICPGHHHGTLWGNSQDHVPVQHNSRSDMDCWKWLSDQYTSMHVGLAW